MINFSRLSPRRQAAVLGFLRWAAVLAFALLLFVIGYYLYTNLLNRAPAQVYIAQRDTATSAVYGTVTVNSLGVLTLVAQNAGILDVPDELKTATVQPIGIIVKKDQLLGTIIDEKGQRDLKDAQLAYNTALTRQKTGPASASPLKAAQDVFERDKLAGNSLPKAEIERARNAVEQYANAVENEKLALQAGVDQAASVMKSAQDQQSRTLLKAPFDGVLTASFFLDRSYVLPNQPVYTVSMLQMNITGQVNEEDVSSLQVDMKADITLYSYGVAKIFKSTLRQILPSPDAISSRYLVALDFDEPPPDLKFGMTGQMNIIRGRREKALIIPSRALTDVDQVLIVEDGVVQPRTIKIGFRSMEFTEVLEGINEGNAVIVADQEDFRPGDHVRPVKVNNLKLKKK